MNVILFGATGMVGQGVLLECLRDEAVRQVLVVGRSPVGVQDPKLREIVLSDLADLSGIELEFSGYDACFFCLGVSSVGMKEDAYRRVTHDLTLAAARTVLAANPDPGLVFVYVSGTGTDSSEKGRQMWARVKGRTENDLLALPMQAYMFRPGYIQPVHGVVSKTALYRVIYRILAPVAPLLRRLLPNQATTTDRLGRAMIAVAASGAETRILGSREINALGG
jgi:uncharacterized protein YbjT (DUF2867 family)